MARIFLSYSRKDEGFARQLAADLKGIGADVWIDVLDIPSGANWSNAIQRGLDSADAMLLIISTNGVESENVQDEWQYFKDQNKLIIPVLLQPAPVHFQLRRLQYVDFYDQPYRVAIQQLEAELARHNLAGRPGVGFGGGTPLQRLGEHQVIKGQIVPDQPTRSPEDEKRDWMARAAWARMRQASQKPEPQRLPMRPRPTTPQQDDFFTDDVFSDSFGDESLFADDDILLDDLPFEDDYIGPSRIFLIVAGFITLIFVAIIILIVLITSASI